ncbi:MAG: hypothetical protein ABSH22_07670 [Tepidisphaeraceae bacterium]
MPASDKRPQAGDCIAVFRRFEEKGKMPFHREGAKNAKQIKKNKSAFLI